MDKKVSKSTHPLKGNIIIPADKSISHRAVILSSLSKGTSVIKNLSKGQDPQSTLIVCKNLGIDYAFRNNELQITSNGLKAPDCILNCQNSGTTMRLMAGVLAGQGFDSVLIGDDSLSSRPMKRIIEPLSLMGAKIESKNYKAPLKIHSSKLHGITYTSSLASAQVKSSILLAGLSAEGKTSYTEPYLSRNHTEIMLSFMGADISNFGCTSTINKSELIPSKIEIPGDISNAAYFIAIALLVPNSEIILQDVGLNPTRTGFIEVLQKMGADIEILDKKNVSGEIAGDLRVRYSNLSACQIDGELIPRLIDEIPILSVISTQANGTTVIKDAQDLRNKESDRIKTIVTELKKLGADIEETPDGMIIQGKTDLNGGVELNSYKDHRLAMSLYTAGLISKKEILIHDFDWIKISFPEFEKLIDNLIP